MGIWKMSQLKSPPMTDDAAELREYVNYLSNQIAIMFKDLDFTLNGDISFQNVKAKSLTADRMNVTELSAITANMGKLTSGEIYGAYIATREAAFPRAEINDDGDLLAVYTDANNYLTIEPGITGEPTIVIRKAGAVSLILGPAFGFTGLLANTPIVLGTQSGNTTIVCGASGTVSVPSWSKLINVDTGTSLQSELDAIWAAIGAKSNSGHTHAVTVTSGGGTFTTSPG
ncbi:hypothetical protein A3842_11235 [Paenibacillus sp. P3E]|uniref:hypothetical protein n=1 Tax=Paenibacillus sp. P3E TaxID=1349435 RepID=UPI00093C25E4|nr:hypothetical protein [Paenibacillus sp. P3E]OKP81644.1 hypothetical protein A3842_11235 [Paenibacillus sp. P3E]